MSPKRRPILVLLAGPNGAGKSTLYDTRIAPSLLIPFINADVIQRDELRDGSMDAAYRAAEIASGRRADLLKGGRSFATETVFSHPSRLDLIHQAKDLSYLITVFHVCVERSDLSVARVAERVKEGGHPVPEDKIRERYERNGPLIRQAILLSDVGHVFDNSALNEPPTRVLSFKQGKLSFVLPKLPGWAWDIYKDDISE